MSLLRVNNKTKTKMATYQEVSTRIKKITKIASSYKIGKTGRSPENRLAGYRSQTKFRKMKIVMRSSNPDVISKMEQAMIYRFRKSTKNKNIGIDNVPMSKSGKYLLYVVYVEKRK